MKAQPGWPEVIAGIRERRGLSLSDIAKTLGLPYVTVWRWAKGGSEPGPEHQRTLLELADLADDRPPGEEEWNRRRILSLRRNLRLTQQEFGQLLGVGRPTVSSWEIGRTRPLACSRLLLTILEGDPPAALGLFASAAVETGAWTGERVHAVRESLGWSRLEMVDLLGISYRTIEDWEAYGLPEHMEYRGCIKMLLSLLEGKSEVLLGYLRA